MHFSLPSSFFRVHEPYYHSIYMDWLETCYDLVFPNWKSEIKENWTYYAACRCRHGKHMEPVVTVNPLDSLDPLACMQHLFLHGPHHYQKKNHRPHAVCTALHFGFHPVSMVGTGIIHILSWRKLQYTQFWRISLAGPFDHHDSKWCDSPEPREHRRERNVGKQKDASCPNRLVPEQSAHHEKKMCTSNIGGM